MTEGSRQARRQRIVDAALRALDGQEYEQVQMRDVASGAGVALGTLYQHFSSKEHLYATVLLEWAAAGRSQAGGQSGASAEERVRTRIHGVITAYERQPQFYRVQVMLQSSADENAGAVLTQFGDIAKVVLTDDLAALGPDLAQDAATMLWSLVTARLTDAIYHGGSMADVHRIAARFVDLIAERLRGL